MTVKDELRDFVALVHHVAPLHYLPAILERGALLSKHRLKEAGFGFTHFRPTSRKRDVESGFETYVHLMTTFSFPLLEDKLAKRYPHVRISMPVDDLPDTGLFLCRYNIAKHRVPQGAFKESDVNGYLIPGLNVPVASSPHVARRLLESRRRTWVEILVPDSVELSGGSILAFFSNDEHKVGSQVAERFGYPGQCRLEPIAQERGNTGLSIGYLRAVAAGELTSTEIPAIRFD